MSDPSTMVWMLFTLLTVGALLLLAGLSLLRFRTKPAGLLLAFGFGLWALQRLGAPLTGMLVPRMMDDPSSALAIQSALIYLVSVFVHLAIGAGILLIPRALGKTAPAPSAATSAS